jgi:hypothetical protein
VTLSYLPEHADSARIGAERASEMKMLFSGMAQPLKDLK